MPGRKSPVATFQQDCPANLPDGRSLRSLPQGEGAGEPSPEGAEPAPALARSAWPLRAWDLQVRALQAPDSAHSDALRRWESTTGLALHPRAPHAEHPAMSSCARVALVTGANKGIGFAIVRDLCRQFTGDVVLTARDTARGQAAVQQLQAEGLSPRFHQLDIDDLQSIRALRDFLRKEYGGLDVLVNNAGIAFKSKGLGAPRRGVHRRASASGMGRICRGIAAVGLLPPVGVQNDSLGNERERGRDAARAESAGNWMLSSQRELCFFGSESWRPFLDCPTASF